MSEIGPQNTRKNETQREAFDGSARLFGSSLLCPLRMLAVRLRAQPIYSRTRSTQAQGARPPRGLLRLCAHMLVQGREFALVEAHHGLGQEGIDELSRTCSSRGLKTLSTPVRSLVLPLLVKFHGTIAF